MSLILLLFVLGLWLFPTATLKSKKPLPRADAIYVFSGGAEYQARTSRAAELFHENRQPTIVLTDDTNQSGWSVSEERNPFYWELARRELVARGVPQASIEVLPEPVFGTHDEAVLLAEFARARRWQTILIVTSDFHAPRSLWTVERVFKQKNVRAAIGVEPVAASAQTAADWTTARIEIVKFWYYRIFY